MPNKKKLIVVTHRVGDGGGMEYVHAQFIRALADEWDISVVAAELDQDIQKYVTWYRAHVPKRPAPIRNVLFFVVAGVRLRSIASTDAVTHSCGAIVPNRVDMSSVHVCHSRWLASTGHLAPNGGGVLRRCNTGVKRLIAITMEQWCYRPRRVSLLHAVSEGVRDELFQRYPGIPIHVLSNGVDLGRYHPDAIARTKIRNLYEISSGTSVALFVGGDWDRKGLELAVRSVAAARRLGADMKLWVVGQGDQKRFERLISDLGIATEVRFFGRQNRLEKFYNGADVLVLPSDYETSSLVAREAAACGLAIVAAPVHGVSEVIGQGEGGIFANADVDVWGKILAELSEARERSRRLGRTACERVAKLDWSLISTQMGSVLGDLLRMKAMKATEVREKDASDQR